MRLSIYLSRFLEGDILFITWLLVVQCKGLKILSECLMLHFIFDIELLISEL